MAARSAVTVLAAASAVLLAAVGFPLWEPLLVAAVLAGTLSGLHNRLAVAVHGKRSLSAALVTVGVVLVVLVPLSLVCLLVVKEALSLVAFIRHTLDQKGLEGLLAPLPEWLKHWADEAVKSFSRGQRNLRTEVTNFSRTSWALGVAAGVVGSVGHAVFMLALMLVALFFLLRDGHALVDWAERNSPMRAGQLRDLLSELRRVSKSVIGAHLATGFIQSAVATLGYAVSGVPSPFLFGVLTLALSFIPSLGAAVVGLPLSGLLWLMGRHGWAIFLLGWSTLVTGLVDNVVRPILVHGGTDLHGALIFFSLLGGVLAFGPIGLIVGPLALALFMSVTTIQRRERAGILS
jgi:predicted PurR-regulated permease PerM